MSPRAGHADRHHRTRLDHATETAEDYVEAIADLVGQHGSCRVVDLARRFGVSHVTVTRIVSRLQLEGWVQTERYRPIVLTARGKRLAAKARHRHQIVYQFLRALGIAHSTAVVDAEGIEHHVSPATLRQFEKFVLERGSHANPAAP